MIIDTLANAPLYYTEGSRFEKAFQFLQNNPLEDLPKGKHEIDGDNIFAIVNEYDSIDPTGEQMEAHKEHIDIQYIVTGEERIGHGFLTSQEPSKAYDPAKDFMLFAEKPDFFSVLKAGMFGIFYPGDLHMPNIQVSSPAFVKKIVIKVKVR